MPSILSIRQSATMFAVLGVVPFAAGQDKPFDPFAPGADKKAPPSPAFTGPSDGKVRIPRGSDGHVTFGPPDCPVYVVGNQVWDAKASRPTTTLELPADVRFGDRIVSADGKWFAAADKSPNQTETGVIVWSTETGKRVLEVPAMKDEYADLIQFAGEKYLLVGGRHDRKISAWDVTTGQVIKVLQTPDRRVESDKIRFSPNGRFFATASTNGIAVTDVPTGKVVGGMAMPPARPAALGVDPTARPSWAFVTAWLRGMAFSPDGTEFAAFSTHPVPRLMVWDLKGQLIIDDPIPGAERVGRGQVFQWLPDKSGWLIDGKLYDRETRRVVLTAKVPFASQVQPHLLGQDQLVGVFGADENLQTVPIPWDKIKAATEAMKNGSAFVSPLDPVTVDVAVTGARGDAGETQRVLATAIAERLTQSGLRTAANAGTVVRLKLAESAGETLPIFERQTRFDFRGQDTGRKATEAKGTAVLEIVAAGQSTPLWRSALAASSSRSFDGDITDATVRKSMIDNLTRQLNDMDIPYFIPKSEDVIALPVVIQ